MEEYGIKNLRGHCAVYVDQIKITLLNSLDMFGENSLVDMEERGAGERVRNATVRVESESVQVLKLSRTTFDQLLQSGRLGESVVEKTKHVSSRRRESNLRRGTGINL